MKVWVVTEFSNPTESMPRMACSMEIFSKKKSAFDFANRDSLAFRTVTEKIVDRYIKIKEA